MYQQPMPQPRDEHERRNSSYADPVSSTGYDEGYAGNPPYSNQLADAIAQRLRYEFRTGMQPSTAPSAGQRLALAIVSIVILVPLLGIILGTASLSGWVTPIALILVSLTIIGVNIAFNFRS